MGMTKKKTKLGDGRSLIYYSFDKKVGSDGKKSKADRAAAVPAEAKAGGGAK